MKLLNYGIRRDFNNAVDSFLSTDNSCIMCGRIRYCTKRVTAN